MVRPIFVRPYPYYGFGFYDPFWDPYFDAPWGVYGPYGYPPYRYNVHPGAAVKFQVKPNKAEAKWPPTRARKDVHTPADHQGREP